MSDLKITYLFEANYRSAAAFVDVEVQAETLSGAKSIAKDIAVDMQPEFENATNAPTPAVELYGVEAKYTRDNQHA